MNITGFSCTNYKAFAKQRIEIRPITLLLGPNSIGKTSINRILLLLNHTVRYGSIRESLVRFDDPNTTPDSLFRNGDVSKDLSLGFTIRNSTTYGSYTQQVINFIVARLEEEFELLYETFNRTLVESDKPIKAKLDSLESWILTLNNPVNLDWALPEDEIRDCFNLLRAVNDLEATQMDVVVHLRARLSKGAKSRRVLQVSKVEVLIPDKRRPAKNRTLLALSLDKIPGTDTPTAYSIDSDIARAFLKKYRASIERSIKDLVLRPKKSAENNSAEIARHIFNWRNPENLFVNFLFGNIKLISLLFYNHFEGGLVNYIPPVREYSSLMDGNLGHKGQSITSALGGPNAAKDTSKPALKREPKSVEAILADDPNILTSVNEWIASEEPERYLKEIIQPSRSLPRGLAPSFKLLWENISSSWKLLFHSGTQDRELRDIGSGYVDALPVLVRTMASSVGSINIVEHPDIHLHPTKQGDFMDFIIMSSRDKERSNGVTHFNKSFIIETHSEYMLQRLRRRIAEGVVHESDVAIYVFTRDKKSGASHAKLMEPNKYGEFAWPENFSSTFNDLQAFIQNRAIRMTEDQAKANASTA